MGEMMKKTIVLPVWFLALFLVAVVMVSLAYPRHDFASTGAEKRLVSAYRERLALLGPFLMLAEKRGVNNDELAELSSCFVSAQQCFSGNAVNPRRIEAFHETQSALTIALAKAVTAPFYTHLMADQTFKRLHVRLDTAESRIARSLADYNRAMHEEKLSERGFMPRLAGLMNKNVRPGTFGSPISYEGAKIITTVIPAQ
jgi:hypothetical protein